MDSPYSRMIINALTKPGPPVVRRNDQIYLRRHKGDGSPDVLRGSNTVGWYDSAESYMIKDSSNLVSTWKDRSTNGNNLTQATGANQPLWSAAGLTFDGTNDYIKATFTLNQPAFFYLVFKQITWTTTDYLFDGGTAITYLSQRTASPGLQVYAGTGGTVSNNLVLNTFGIVRILFNGASSKFIINDNTPLAENTGANNPGGITIGSKNDGTAPSNIQVKEVIVRNTADTAANEAAIYAYLSNKHSI